jgi:protein TIF31
LANFLREKAVVNITNDLKTLDSIPTDSLSLEAFFHARGVNMRYLGKVLSLVYKHKDSDVEK